MHGESKKLFIGFVLGLIAIIIGSFVLVATLIIDYSNLPNSVIGLISISIGSIACLMCAREKGIKNR